MCGGAEDTAVPNFVDTSSMTLCTCEETSPGSISAANQRSCKESIGALRAEQLPGSPHGISALRSTGEVL